MVSGIKGQQIGDIIAIFLGGGAGKRIQIRDMHRRGGQPVPNVELGDAGLQI